MTPTDNPTGSLTRRQLRELRMTGQTPTLGEIVNAEAEAIAPPQRDANDAVLTPAPTPTVAPVPAVPLARAAEPVELRPTIDAAKVDVTARPRTRREARAIEQVRTASVPIISDAIPAAVGEPELPVFEAPAEMAAVSGPVVLEEPEPATPAPSATFEETPQPPAPRAATDSWVAPAEVVDAVVEPEATPVEAEPVVDTPAPVSAESAVVAEEVRPQLRPEFGSAVLDAAAQDNGVPSFDDLLTQDRDGSGSSQNGSALIVPGHFPPLTAPVTATGEMLVTGTFSLPEGLGSQGHAPGVADGKDVDVVLIDGELPAASSPTPIAATAAVSQAKAPGDIIKPPVPEKSNKTMLALMITAGVLAVVLGAVSYFVLTSGVLG